MGGSATTWEHRAVDGGTPTYPPDFDADLIALCERVRPFTLTSPERIAALRDAVRYLIRSGAPGDFVECGGVAGWARCW